MKRLVLLTAIVLLLVAAVWIGARSLLSSPGDADVLSDAASATETQLALPTEVTERATDAPIDSTETVIILHTNDFHGAVGPEVDASGGGESGGLVNLVSLIDEVRALDPGHTLVLDAGDSFQGSYVSNSTYGEVVMAGMNIAHYDAWTLGNHEFDWGQEQLRARIAQAQFPALAANLLDASTGMTGARELWDAVQPYIIVEVGHARIGILGLTYPDTPVITRAGVVAGLEFRGSVETVGRYLPELEQQADLVIVLSHLGYDGDRLLARAVDGIDVIVGGHSHVFLERPDRVNGTLIVQAGAKGQVLGRLVVTVDLESGTVIDYSQEKVLLPVTDSVAEVNQQAEALVSAAMAEAAETITQPIGETVRTLEPQRAGEFALGNLIVDAMLTADLSDGLRPDIAMHNNGGIRAALPQGPVTYGQLYAVLPFDNQLIALDLTGAQVLEILEHSIADGTANMQVGGMTFRFNSSQPRGQRITEAALGGEPLEKERVYRVVTIDYLAGGGGGQETFLEGTNPTYGDTAVWAVAEYIRANSPVDPQIEGRIQGR
jgi:5'-nucleotidase/UDP-sugar diphosphatase